MPDTEVGKGERAESRYYVMTDCDGVCCAESVRCNCNELGSHVMRIADRGGESEQHNTPGKRQRS